MNDTKSTKCKIAQYISECLLRVETDSEEQIRLARRAISYCIAVLLNNRMEKEDLDWNGIWCDFLMNGVYETESPSRLSVRGLMILDQGHKRRLLAPCVGKFSIKYEGGLARLSNYEVFMPASPNMFEETNPLLLPINASPGECNNHQEHCFRNYEQWSCHYKE
jgi:hypothetical protein